ncbi:MAG: sugar ABC transporter substrate-binding protein [Alphaproteobacteria bacterium]|jgi:fructose transport system substrate-binding protein|uniref:Fructose transport system substrate-binding protein n=1 Tax=Celeribacter baekdonensis TaxID=875171 RepID=A0A1G7H1I8_9RHOB|nr:sugar ABC transporter substrate-binding protein [Celeribacter baekdonensis]MBU0645201.1 sugar ABC transporter substrate-binding protein [Alphaproteobacteria bacterium]MBU1278452.1 sugar ABC transporter substrate-binding protein [Alphaproteobacteria bacterium]MBU1574890.1 sugar ABC transporter substrate-binding protein [Alphaproteobacteria bacterium]MBU1830641.1 sugar ABC transporter substrate-binding protein [Alphaproteobacteria bacterium]MBU2080229.1 sugar ABC transporter substrate-binding
MKQLLTGSAIALALTASGAFAEDISACLVTKTDTNPFFVKMKEGASAQAEALGIKLNTYAGKLDGDVETQIAAVESCIAGGAKGILITPSDSRALAPVVTQAREAGVLVIALDTPFEPTDTADATFATDNFLAGELIGQWAAAKMGDTSQAKIALLDLNPSEVSVDYLRNNGFLQGFGVDIKDPKDIGDEDDARIVGNDVTNGNEEGGRTAMENLLQKDSGVNVVYTINEPAAAGAYEALKSMGLESQALIVSVDGGCPGVQNVKDGVIGATSMQFPLLMASKGIEAIKAYADTGEKPMNSEGLDFFNTGVELVTDQPVEGIPSITSEEALGKCWG